MHTSKHTCPQAFLRRRSLLSVCRCSSVYNLLWLLSFVISPDSCFQLYILPSVQLFLLLSSHCKGFGFVSLLAIVLFVPFTHMPRVCVQLPRRTDPEAENTQRVKQYVTSSRGCAPHEVRWQPGCPTLLIMLEYQSTNRKCMNKTNDPPTCKILQIRPACIALCHLVQRCLPWEHSLRLLIIRNQRHMFTWTGWSEVWCTCTFLWMRWEWVQIYKTRSGKKKEMSMSSLRKVMYYVM